MKNFVCIDVESPGDYWDSIIGIYSAISETAVYEHLCSEKNMTRAQVLKQYIVSEVETIKLV